MQVTSLLSSHEHDHAGADDGCSACGSGHDHSHEHSPVHLWQTILGVIFVVNAFVVDWLFQQSYTVASVSAFIGSIILGYPIILTAVRDLRRGFLSINELVAIAVLAAFASGEYKTAGVVAFFMLMGEIIETRTAEGARASIESLIKLTPTKARRIRKDGSEKRLPPANWPSATSSAFVPATTWRPTASSRAARDRSIRPRSPASRCRRTRSPGMKCLPARRT
jgi:Cd2+/Zn2+-exporting ATPase